MKAMENLFFVLLITLIIASCQGQGMEKELGEVQSLNNEDHHLVNVTIPIKIKEKQNFFLLSDLINTLGGDFTFDSVHRTLHLDVNHHTFSLTDGVPVVEKDGEYLATDVIYLKFDDEDNVYLPVEFIEIALGTEVTYQNDSVRFDWLGTSQQVFSTFNDIRMEDWDIDQMVRTLSFLEKPIKGAEISKIPSHLPGAPRNYRNGFHEGIDWYDFASGGGISTSTPVYAMGDGVVVRADHNYVEYRSAEVRNQDLKYTAELGLTPDYIIDRLRGRQVWVQYQGGVMNRFAHLHDIPASIQVGDKVDAETIIGYVGNSGTSDGVNENYEDGLHLHQDLLIFGEYFWRYLSEEEVIEVLERIWE